MRTCFVLWQQYVSMFGIEKVLCEKKKVRKALTQTTDIDCVGLYPFDA